MKPPEPFPTPIKWKEYQLDPLGAAFAASLRGIKPGYNHKDRNFGVFSSIWFFSYCGGVHSCPISRQVGFLANNPSSGCLPINKTRYHHQRSTLHVSINVDKLNMELFNENMKLSNGVFFTMNPELNCDFLDRKTLAEEKLRG